jgi:hypothetical protein
MIVIPELLKRGNITVPVLIGRGVVEDATNEDPPPPPPPPPLGVTMTLVLPVLVPVPVFPVPVFPVPVVPVPVVPVPLPPHPDVTIGVPTILISSIQTKSLLSPRSSRIRRANHGASAASAGSEREWLVSVSDVVKIGVGITQIPLLVAISVSSAA